MGSYRGACHGDGVSKPSFTELESHVMASDAPAVCIVDRDAMRELFKRLRVLEAKARRTVFVEEGNFW